MTYQRRKDGIPTLLSEHFSYDHIHMLVTATDSPAARVIVAHQPTIIVALHMLAHDVCQAVGQIVP